MTRLAFAVEVSARPSRCNSHASATPPRPPACQRKERRVCVISKSSNACVSRRMEATLPTEGLLSVIQLISDVYCDAHKQLAWRERYFSLLFAAFAAF